MARTDVPLPCCSGPGNDDNGGGGSGGGGIATSKAKVFAVFDGHGGAEVARFCQMNLVPVLTSQEAWKKMSIAANNNNNNKPAATDSNHDAEGTDEAAAAMEEEEEFDHITPEAKSLGQALIDSFHALDRLIDDPKSRGEIDRWRMERPPPYVSEEEGANNDDEEKEEEQTESSSEKTENTEAAELQPIDKGENVQQRRHTAMDQNEIADSVAKLQQVLATAADAEEEDEEKAGECDINEPSETDSDDLENKAADGVVHDDSDEDDDDEKVEISNTNENDDGEIADTTDCGEEEEKGTVTLSSSDAVALFQKLLHLNVSNDDDDSDEDDDDDDEGNSKTNGYSDVSGEGQDSSGEVVIPTKEQLLNPPTGIVAPSASVPTKIQNGRKVRLCYFSQLLFELTLFFFPHMFSSHVLSS